MELSEIASVSGKSGLYKVVKPTKTGVILESLDESKSRIVAAINNKVSMLHEISIYTNNKDGVTPLDVVLKKINAEYGDDTGIDANADTSELKAFLKSVLPDYDEERVYASDIKKLIKWYSILLKYVPEVMQENTDSKTDSTDTQPANPD
jgi:hypothetical protein